MSPFIFTSYPTIQPIHLSPDLYSEAIQLLTKNRREPMMENTDQNVPCPTCAEQGVDSYITIDVKQLFSGAGMVCQICRSVVRISPDDVESSSAELIRRVEEIKKGLLVTGVV